MSLQATFWRWRVLLLRAHSIMASLQTFLTSPLGGGKLSVSRPSRIKILFSQPSATVNLWVVMPCVVHRVKVNFYKAAERSKTSLSVQVHWSRRDQSNRQDRNDGKPRWKRSSTDQSGAELLPAWTWIRLHYLQVKRRRPWQRNRRRWFHPINEINTDCCVFPCLYLDFFSRCWWICKLSYNWWELLGHNRHFGGTHCLHLQLLINFTLCSPCILISLNN